MNPFTFRYKSRVPLQEDVTPGMWHARGHEHGVEGLLPHPMYRKNEAYMNGYKKGINYLGMKHASSGRPKHGAYRKIPEYHDGYDFGLDMGN